MIQTRVIKGLKNNYIDEKIDVSIEVNLVNKNKVLDITSPCLLKMIFRKNKLINIEQL